MQNKTLIITTKANIFGKDLASKKFCLKNKTINMILNNPTFVNNFFPKSKIQSVKLCGVVLYGHAADPFPFALLLLLLLLFANLSKNPSSLLQ